MDELKSLIKRKLKPKLLLTAYILQKMISSLEASLRCNRAWDSVNNPSKKPFLMEALKAFSGPQDTAAGAGEVGPCLVERQDQHFLEELGQGQDASHHPHP